MTRTNFQWVAAWVARHGVEEDAIAELCEYFQERNPQFNETLFRVAIAQAKS